MKILGYAAAAAIGLLATGASAQSAKFDADWDAGTVTLASVSQVANCDINNTGAMDCDMDTGATELLATIKIPQGKEALIGVSGVADLLTLTKVKGKNDGGTVTAKAEATMDLEVRLAPTSLDLTTAQVCASTDPAEVTLAAPGAITFASRIQELSLAFDIDTDPEAAADFIEIGLKVNTTAAHHFNFVAYDLASDEYHVVACFSGEAFAGIDGSAGGSLAEAVVAIQHRMVTVQEVRAVKGAFDDEPVITVGN